MYIVLEIDTDYYQIEEPTTLIIEAYDFSTPSGITEGYFSQAGQLLGSIGDSQPLALDAPTTEGMLLIARLSETAKMKWEVVDFASLVPSAYPPGHRYGLTLSNNASDATNDIDIATGSARDSTGAVSMTLASALTKRLDAAWALGTNQGGLDTGSIANATYFVWLIKNTSTGDVDALFSLSASSPTMPSGYSYKRRIGAIIRASATIRPFVQDGNHFSLVTPVTEINGVDPGATTAITRTLTGVPIGIRVKGYFTHGNNIGASSSVGVWLTDLSTTDITPASTYNNLWTTLSQVSSTTVVALTNTSGQIRTRHSYRDASTLYFLVTQGWDDLGI